MDEPSSGLDPVARVEMKELLMNLQSMGKTIIISSHILADISEMCNAIGIMSHGRIISAGKMEDILKIGTDTSRLVLTFNQGIENAVMILQEYQNIRIESVRENQIIIAGVADDMMACRLVNDLISRGVILSGFHRDEKSLEQIFMNITGGN